MNNTYRNNEHEFDNNSCLIFLHADDTKIPEMSVTSLLPGLYKEESPGSTAKVDNLLKKPCRASALKNSQRHLESRFI